MADVLKVTSDQMEGLVSTFNTNADSFTQAIDASNQAIEGLSAYWVGEAYQKFRDDMNQLFTAARAQVETLKNAATAIKTAVATYEDAEAKATAQV